jgi:transposase
MKPLPKLLDPERRGGSRDAYLWGYHSAHENAVVLEFSPSRSGEILYDFFPSGWRGIAQTDGAAMYTRVFRHRPGILHIECMAHLRRYVLEAIKSDEHQAIPLLRDITELYRIERMARLLGLTHDQRGYLGHAKAKPVLRRLQRKLRALEHTAPPSGNLRDAVTYANRRWPRLLRYAKIGFGHVHIDQNPLERCFRSGKVGLRNYLFIGHPAAGWRTAVIYTVFATCKLVGVNPESISRGFCQSLQPGRIARPLRDSFRTTSRHCPTANRSRTACAHCLNKNVTGYGGCLT